MDLVISRFEVHRGARDPTVGREIRTVDQSRLVKKLGRIDSRTSLRVLEVFQELFAP